MKILVTADVHLHDFRQHNILGDPLFRLHQYGKLADRLVQIIEQENCEAVIIAGDYTHVASPRPYVSNYAADVLAKIAKAAPIYAISGQHEMDTRTSMAEHSSFWGLYKHIDNVTYADKKIITLGGRKFYFQSWSEDQDFSHLDDKEEIDVLIGHATIPDTHINQMNVKLIGSGQEMNLDRFKIGFFGDIHYPQVKGKQVIPGVPIQANFGDHPDNGVIILDTEDLSWKRVKTETPEYRFLKFLVTTEPEKYADDPYVVTKLPPDHSGASLKDRLHTSVNIMDVIDKSVVAADLLKLHDEVLASTSNISEDTVDLRFEVLSLKINNFRSIEDFEWTPSSGVTLINGLNGSGKSTLVRALDYVFNNSGTARKLIRVDQNEMSVDITIMYDNVKYRIVRGWTTKGYLEYYINDILTENENMNACHKRMREDLRFLSMYNIMYHDQNRPRFLSSFNYGSRVDLVSKIVGLSIVDKLRATAEQFRSRLDIPQRNLENEISAIDMYLESMKLVTFDDMNLDYTDQISKLTGLIEVLSSISNIKSQIKEYDQKIQIKQSAISEYDSIDLSDATKSTEELDTLISNLETKQRALQTSMLNLNSEINSINNTINNSRNDVKRLTSDISEHNCKIDTLSASNCYVCSQTIDEDKIISLKSDLSSKVVTIQNQIKDLMSSMPSMMKDLETRKSDLPKISDDLEKISVQISDLKSTKSNIDTIKSQAARLESHKREMLSLVDQKSSLSTKDLEAVLLEKYNIDTSKVLNLEPVAQVSTNNLAVIREKQAHSEKLKKMHAEIEIKSSRKLVAVTEIEELKTKRAEYDKYISLMAPGGVVVRSVLTTLSEQLSNDKIKVVAQRFLASGEARPDFSLHMNVKGRWIEYDELSGGQQSVCDIFIMYHLLNIAGGCGLLIFDETFGQLDTENLEFTVNLIKDVDARNLIIVSHHESFPYYDSHIVARLSDNGTTQYTIN